jgi:hypothetical protein
MSFNLSDMPACVNSSARYKQETNNMQSWNQPFRGSRAKIAGLCLAAVMMIAGAATQARGGVPAWLRTAAGASLPDYPEETVAVMLLNEQTTSVNKKGEMKTRYRRAYKILRPEGSRYGIVAAYFDEDTPLTYLKAWSLPSGEKEYEVKEKDAVVTSPFFGELYTDTLMKWLQIPAAHPGNVVGYEYEQKGRPLVLHDIWGVAQPIPVRHARYTLHLPKQWEFEASWVHFPTQKPAQKNASTYTWQFSDIPAVEPEPAMPHWSAVAGRLVVCLSAPGEQATLVSHGSWDEVGHWYRHLAHPMRRGSPEIQQKVIELTTTKTNLLDKIKALAAFVQRQVRYVAIEVGIGDYRPHAASAVFANRYGDCKDKATLMAAMLTDLGIESHYVLVHLSRGVVEPATPTLGSFNHAILAIELPQELPTEGLYAMCNDEGYERMLFFDPTDPMTPFGYLPASLQAGHGLVVTAAGGELLKLPMMPPIVNRMLRTGKFVLSDTGSLTGTVQEIRWGTPAIDLRRVLGAVSKAERIKVLEEYLADDVGGFNLFHLGVANVERYDQNLLLEYRFLAEEYAKKVGSLLLFRPRLFDELALDLIGEKPRRYPVEFANTTSIDDSLEFILPAGYEVSELPLPVDISNDFAEYKSEVEAEPQVLRYKRRFTLKKIFVPAGRSEELQQFFRQVSVDERNHVVLQKIAP